MSSIGPTVLATMDLACAALSLIIAKKGGTQPRSSQ